jgi:hypothetical protein
MQHHAKLDGPLDRRLAAAAEHILRMPFHRLGGTALHRWRSGCFDMTAALGREGQLTSLLAAGRGCHVSCC